MENKKEKIFRGLSRVNKLLREVGKYIKRKANAFIRLSLFFLSIFFGSRRQIIFYFKKKTGFIKGQIPGFFDRLIIRVGP